MAVSARGGGSGNDPRRERQSTQRADVAGSAAGRLQSKRFDAAERLREHHRVRKGASRGKVTFEALQHPSDPSWRVWLCAVDGQTASRVGNCQDFLTGGERIARLPEQQTGNINENFSIYV